MRLLCAFVLAAVLSFSFSAVAEAGQRRSDIRAVGVGMFDDVFLEAKAVDQIVIDSQRQRRRARKRVNAALGLEPSTSFPDALQALQRQAPGKLQVSVRGGVPALVKTGVLPEDVVHSVQAVNTAARRYRTVLRNVTALPEKCASLVSAISRFDVTSLQDALKIKTPQDALRHAGKLSTYHTNVTTIAALPKKVSRLLRNVRSDIAAVSSAFSEDRSAAAPRKRR